MSPSESRYPTDHGGETDDQRRIRRLEDDARERDRADAIFRREMLDGQARTESGLALLAQALENGFQRGTQRMDQQDRHHENADENIEAIKGRVTVLETAGAIAASDPLARWAAVVGILGTIGTAMFEWLKGGAPPTGHP